MMNEAVAQRTKDVDEKFCSECGKVINAKAEICPNCGVRQMASPSTFGNVAPNGKSRLAAVLFAFFLGPFGVHKFYLGRVGAGILYLLFIWTMIPSILALIDAIMLLVMSDETFNRKYGRS